MLQIRSHATAAGNFDGDYSVEIRHATSTVTHGMLISNKETDDARRTLDVADGNGVFATFTNGKVGIGTEIPSKTLDVSGNGTFSGSLLANPLQLTSGDSWIRSGYGAISNSTVLSLNNLLIAQNMRGWLSGLDGGSNNNNFYHVVTHGGMGYNGIEFCYGGTMKFYTNSGGTTANNTFTPSERLRITSDGKIGIGTESPTAMLEVGNQSKTLAGAITVSNGEIIGGGTGPVITLKHGPAGGTQRTHQIYSYIGDLRIVADSNENIEFHTGGGESLRITSGRHIMNGNLTISGSVNTDNATVGGYGQVQCDNHANTFFGQNIKLSASSGSGTHQLQIINQHSSIGGAGMWIGGNGNSYNNQINFYAIDANQPAGYRVDEFSRFKIDTTGVTVNRIGAPQAQLDVNQASGHPAFNIGFPDGSFYRNLGTAGPSATDGSTGAYLHVRLRTVWNDSSMTMFRLTGYYPYSVYAESYVGMYRYGHASYRNSPYGQIIANQGTSSLVHSVYNTGVNPGYLVIVCYWNTDYNGVMIEHNGAGSSYGSYMQTDLEIIDTKRSSSASDQWPS